MHPQMLKIYTTGFGALFHFVTNIHLLVCLDLLLKRDPHPIFVWQRCNLATNPQKEMSQDRTTEENISLWIQAALTPVVE